MNECEQSEDANEDVCKNGGTCSNTEGSYECNCTEGWQGEICETLTINTLTCNDAKDPCNERGVCSNNPQNEVSNPG